ncbi:uncharacterized protein LOC107042304 [Diachasma alloeum]|uniref:uncharacterized protein LOC107042304 n=1 Tax=Diachasma alloeum TaxID=454923 RepID=UPI0007384848|nr:uncharacterized protein LOC107042304 [Diachasma alloeum]
MGLARNTPDYIWRMEAGVSSVEVEAVRRAAAFLIKLSRMEESRWPRKCLKEELRGIKNGQPSSWGQGVIERLREVGDGEFLEHLREGRKEEAEKRLKDIVEIVEDQEKQKDWERIEKSKYCDHYGEIKENTEMCEYWTDRKLNMEQKMAWARWRCGNAIRGGKKGFEDDRCRACEKEKESLEHVVSCKEIMRRVGPHDERWWKRWRQKSNRRHWRERIIEELRDYATKRNCDRFGRIEKALREE